MVPQKPLLAVGDEFLLSTVIAVHHQENHGVIAGVVLTFSLDERYMVRQVDPNLNVIIQEQYMDGPKAYLRYVKVVAKLLFTYHNQIAPGLSFEVKNDA